MYETTKRGNQLIAFLKELFPAQLDMIEKYVREALHGDGDAYWDLFSSYQELADDFELYVVCVTK